MKGKVVELLFKKKLTYEKAERTGTILAYLLVEGLLRLRTK